jgi:serine/threonine-protein kinase
MICPTCHRVFADPAQRFCHEDGTRLVEPPAPRPTLAIREAPVHSTREMGAVVEGRYVIRGFLGEGGMARVYLAEDARSGAKVAVKILRRELTGKADVRERFLREIDVAAAIHHPNIARILDAGERKDGAPFLVIEFLSGESMGDVLEREGAFPEPYALELTREAASALVAAHREGVIHRDVKPDNFFLTVDGRLKMVDFGFAKLKEGSVTVAGTAVGTVPYMAPEQASGDPVDARTDVYGLGVTLFHMLTGAVPFDANNDTKIVAAHLYAQPPAPSSLRPGLDHRIDRVVLAAMRKRPDQRYLSMVGLLEDVERLLGERPGPIAPPPQSLAPDVYEAQTPMSRTMARFLRGLVP